jgi:SAM-dependent methyltransferase
MEPAGTPPAGAAIFSEGVLMAGRFVSRTLMLAIAVLIVALPAWAQEAATQKPFEPQVGQAGNKMLDMAKVTPQDFVMDLGSGDGRTVITAAKRGARALGIEYNPNMVELSRKNAAAAGMTQRATFQQADLFETDFSKAQVITMFLLPSINMKLRPKLLELRPGTRIVSNTFTMEDWEADETQRIEQDCTSWCTALLWIVPAKVEGTWHIGQNNLVLKQQFQMLSGTLGSTMITAGRMRGDEITFTAGNAVYTGRVSGNGIKGSIKGGSGGTFTATR